ncbi:transposase [Trichothermofontia sichuanensis B231]|uniref:transposase n=1 Tax=Trichothermofontia sichuanensis TaxID=3045816 RepID=UPI002245B81A|nr:transposase [Trichothermofontia sichuanensis]UZQ53739.1 transposase [Trichothermofontia sichuanensis B231]
MIKEFWPKKRSILIDGTEINLALTHLCARAPKGKRAPGKHPQKRGKNVSVIGVIGLQVMIAYVAVMRSLGKLKFEAFIACELVPKLWAGADVIMDNAAIHCWQTRLRQLLSKFLKPILSTGILIAVTVHQRLGNSILYPLF